MPVKTKEVEKEEIQIEDFGFKITNPNADVHHMIQRIGMQTTVDGAITGDQADELLRTWVQRGYRLAFVCSLGLEPNGAAVLYLLIKDA